ncbi:MAG TPA: hypothetical protein VF595_03305 [Tepidisphaeraceae bacterium]
MRNRLRTAAAALLLSALAGCASNDGMTHLSVQKADGGDPYTASFERALFTESPNGSTDLILLSSGGVRQVVHIRVLWQPTRTIRIDSASAGNAMIDWLVSASDKDRVVYGGSCWAKVSVDGDEAEVDLREAAVSVRHVDGQMTDPLQRANLSGKFVAKRADASVRAYVDEMAAAGRRTATAAALPKPLAVTP